jgi:tRNA(Ile)-lysidine synthase
VVEQGTHKPLAGGSNPPSATSPADPLAVVAGAFQRGTDALGVDHQAPIVLAVSGGPDSMALLHGAHRLARDGTRAWPLVVAHLDHGLRATSEADASHVAQLAHDLGLPFHGERADVAALARDEGRSIEDAGRQARYRFLQRVADETAASALIATAHTADDVAETVLLRIARGSGLRGLRGIPARRGRVIRPLLGERRATLRAALDAAGIGYLEDPTNLDPAAADRNRVRHEVLPALEQLNPRAVDALQRLGRLAADDDDALDAMAAAELTRRRTVDGIDWRRPPARAIGRRVMRLASGEPAPSAERIEALLDAAEGARGGVVIELGAGREASVRARHIQVRLRSG